MPQFRYDPTWPKPLPNQWRLGAVVGVHVDSRDHVWIVHRPNTLTEAEGRAGVDPPIADCCRPAPPVIEFDQAGNVVQAWGGPGSGYDWPTPAPNRGMQGEHGIFVDYRDNVWLGANGLGDGMVLKFSRTGKFVLQIGHQGRNTRATGASHVTDNLNAATVVAVEPKTNEVFVADGYGNARIIVFDADTGAYKHHWGAYGKTPDDKAPNRDGRGYQRDAPIAQWFSQVHCVELSRDQLVYVCDRGNNRIQVFREDGTFVNETRVAPWTLRSGNVHDVALSKDPEQRYLYVADGNNQKVRILLRSDLSHIGSFGHGGHEGGAFGEVTAIDVDSKGNIYGGETFEGKRVQRFNYVGLGPATAIR